MFNCCWLTISDSLFFIEFSLDGMNCCCFRVHQLLICDAQCTMFLFEVFAVVVVVVIALNYCNPITLCLIHFW